jgi:hypothetical protein
VNTRDDIITALAKVDGLSPVSTQPGVLAAGAAWPVWDHDEWLNPCSYKEFWFVHVALVGGDRAGTVLAGDDLRVPIAEALFTVPIFVDRVEPSAVQAEDGGQTVPTLLFSISR